MGSDMRQRATATATASLMAARMAALVTALATLAGPAAAHDSWFEPQPPSERGELVLALGTGNQFPVLDSSVLLEHLQAAGCLVAGNRPLALRWMADRPTALVLRSTRPAPAPTPLSCWARLVPLEITVAEAVVPVYLDEIRAQPAVRAHWADLQARGLPWTEVYTKHARLEAGPAPDELADGSPVTTPAIAALGMDVRLTRPAGGLRAGDTLQAQVLRDGQPLAGQMIELRNDLSPLGLWRQTDAEGRLSIPLPLAARWLLRGVDLRPSDADPTRWDSRFVTVAFEVLPRR